jgi:hypothetical protein
VVCELKNYRPSQNELERRQILDWVRREDFKELAVEFGT